MTEFVLGSMKVKQFLIEAKARISDPAHWIQGTAVGACGTKFCYLGALQEQTRIEGVRDGVSFSFRTYGAAYNRLRGQCGGFLINFNDHSSHAEVMAMWDRAIEECTT